jgi:antitoxin (DNA-binding transcriptional repressor) of toxin-antitoxin stability system
MTDNGTLLVVEAGEKGLEDLLEIVRRDGRTVRICVRGEPVADLSPPAARRRLFPLDPKLKVTFLTDSDHLMTADDWPERLRIDPKPPVGT